jgi:hypothetical protein
MIVAVESNFVLELALRQEEAADADRIVKLAETSKIQLVIPACALFEPYETLVRRSKQRGDLINKLRSEIEQLARSANFAHLRDSSTPVTGTLAESLKIEAGALCATIRRLADVALVLPLSDQTLKAAIDIQVQLRLQPQDAVVFASIDRFLSGQGSGQKLFANRNSRDFLPHEVHFQRYNCKVLPRFDDARRFIERHVS